MRDFLLPGSLRELLRNPPLMTVRYATSGGNSSLAVTPGDLIPLRAECFDPCPVPVTCGPAGDRSACVDSSLLSDFSAPRDESATEDDPLAGFTVTGSRSLLDEIDAELQRLKQVRYWRLRQGLYWRLQQVRYWRPRHVLETGRYGTRD